MARRSLPKIDPALDLSNYLLTLEELPKPWDPLALFGRVAPLEIEVGSGKGLFLIAAAAAHPDHNFLGSEIAERYARYCAARLAKRSLQNVRMLHGDAQRMLAEFLPDSSARAVHIYFPDPWWKKRHKKRRVVNPASLQSIQRVLEPGGKLHFWTDVEEYFHTGLEFIAAHTTLSGPIEVPEPVSEHDFDFRTNFERRTRLHGDPVYRAEFRKPQPPIARP
jgi:tRNA (guanine-N7-)-methyltransferase